MLNKEKRSYKVILIILLLIIAILSITLVSKYTTSAEHHASTIEYLDGKKSNALALAGSVAVTSTVLAAVPGDATTAISTQISELSKPLFIIVCALYLEKFLLTSIGYLSFDILIPTACLCCAIYIFSKKEIFKSIASKLLILAIASYLIIPASVKISTLIEATFEKSIAQTNESVEKISEEAEALSEDKKTNIFSEAISKLTTSMKDFAKKAKDSLNIFIDAIAVMIITTCVIPIGVILFMMWIIKILFGANIKSLKERHT